ncbi:MAG TPA: hypothetical protein PLW10_20615 [Myxococcota bacterium]|nr:hypothetical protein [Myxococcota bacterium]
MHARSTARSAGPLRLALRRIPFTLGLIGLLVTVAVVTSSHSRPLPDAWLARLGFATADLWLLELERIATSAVSTHGGAYFWRALVAVSAIVGSTEWRTGTLRTAVVFSLSHVGTLLVLAVVVGVGLRSWHPPLAALLDVTRDVGPSAGYFGCLALACRSFPRRIGLPVAALVLIGLVISTIAATSGPIPPADSADVSATIAHLIAFPLGWLLAITAFAARTRCASKRAATIQADE